MNGKIYVMDGDELHALSESEYEAEKKLQKLLQSHPDLLAGGQMNDAEPRRWILVDREFGISDIDLDDWNELRHRTERLDLNFPEDPGNRKHPQRSLEGADGEWWETFRIVFDWIHERATTPST